MAYLHEKNGCAPAWKNPSTGLEGGKNFFHVVEGVKHFFILQKLFSIFVIQIKISKSKQDLNTQKDKSFNA